MLLSLFVVLLVVLVVVLCFIFSVLLLVLLLLLLVVVVVVVVVVLAVVLVVALVVLVVLVDVFFLVVVVVIILCRWPYCFRFFFKSAVLAKHCFSRNFVHCLACSVREQDCVDVCEWNCSFERTSSRHHPTKVSSHPAISMHCKDGVEATNALPDETEKKTNVQNCFECAFSMSQFSSLDV